MPCHESGLSCSTCFAWPVGSSHAEGVRFFVAPRNPCEAPMLAQITMGGWIMSGAWIIFMVCAWFGFDDPLAVRRAKCAGLPLCILLLETYSPPLLVSCSALSLIPSSSPLLAIGNCSEGVRASPTEAIQCLQGGGGRAAGASPDKRRKRCRRRGGAPAAGGAGRSNTYALQQHGLGK